MLTEEVLYFLEDPHLLTGLSLDFDNLPTPFNDMIECIGSKSLILLIAFLAENLLYSSIYY
jgi:hypothetical protein